VVSVTALYSTHPAGGSSRPRSFPRHGASRPRRSFASSSPPSSPPWSWPALPRPDLQIGVADELGFHADQSAWFFDSLGDLGMQENRVAVPFDAAEPTVIQKQVLLDAYVPLATLRGVRVVFSVAPSKARAMSENPNAVEQYAEYVALLARTYPTVTDFIVGNEPNQPRFWQPQFGANGQNVSAAAYYSMLAAAYASAQGRQPRDPGGRSGSLAARR
jgi:hypothetical protein